MPILKKLFKFFVFIPTVFIASLALVRALLMSFFSGLTASGSAHREMQENDLNYRNNMNLDEFTCSIDKSINIPVCMNGYGQETNGYKFNKKYNR